MLVTAVTKTSKQIHKRQVESNLDLEPIARGSTDLDLKVELQMMPVKRSMKPKATYESGYGGLDNMPYLNQVEGYRQTKAAPIEYGHVFHIKDAPNLNKLM